MKEIAQQILNAPFNWTGLTLKELVNADRIPQDQLGRIFKDLATAHLTEKYVGQNPGIQQYLIEKDHLEAALEEVYFNQN